MAEPTKANLEAFIQRAGFSYGWENLESWARRMAERAVTELTAADRPIDMVLYCPACGVQHVDAPEHGSDRVDPYPSSTGGDDPALSWTNPPHRSHLCHGCGHVWRPADVPTNGVAAVTTKGRNDSPIVPQAAVAAVVAEVKGCFESAMAEGLAEALAETPDARLKDLVERRLMYAYYAAERETARPVITMGLEGQVAFAEAITNPPPENSAMQKARDSHARLIAAQPAASRVFLVATGETVDGQETYTRHEGAPPPLCDFETLYTAALQPAASFVGLGQSDLAAPANVDQRVAVATPQAQEVAASLVDLGRDGSEHQLQPAGSALPHDAAPVMGDHHGTVALQPAAAEPAPGVTAVIHESEPDFVHATLTAPRPTEYTLEATREEGKDWYITVTAENGMRDYLGYWKDSAHRTAAEVLVEAARGACLGTLTPPAPVEQPAAVAHQPRLKVRLTSFPESNGKRNWTALLVREDATWLGLTGNAGGITIDRGEFWNRVAYRAERTKFLLGLRDTEPCILDYGDDIRTPDEWKGEVHGGRPADGRASFNPGKDSLQTRAQMHLVMGLRDMQRAMDENGGDA